MTNSNPNLHWDGTQWLSWTGSAWVSARQAALDEIAQLTKREQQWTEAVHQLQREHAELQERDSALRASIADLTDAEALQEVGIYRYTHPLDNVVLYQESLAQVRAQIRSAFGDNHAISATTDWTVNNSAAKGRKMVKDFSKLMLRAYNAEADTLVRNMKPHKLQASVDRLTKTRQTIARLGLTMSIAVTDYYHSLRVFELEIVADYLAKKEEEKEQLRAERERQREEQQAMREFEREKARLLKERAHYVGVLKTLELSGSDEEIEEFKLKLEEIDSSISDVEGREANIRAGFVYVISNVGSFGEGVVKVGLTRRLTPMDRVYELGDASVPFRFDVHALIFSKDAVGLEAELHRRLTDRRINMVNLRREFFRAKPSDVRDLIMQIDGTTLLEFTEVPEALEWRASNANQ